jgi:uncharacterized surface protein with fasciclin (FAS1) repeats
MICSPLTTLARGVVVATAAAQTGETAKETVHNNNNNKGRDPTPPATTCTDRDHEEQQSHHQPPQGGDDDDVDNDLVHSVLDIIEKAPGLQRFHYALVRAKLVDMLIGPPAPLFITVVVPTDQALQDFRSKTARRIFRNEEWILHLRDLLLYHIHLGDVPLVDRGRSCAEKVMMSNGQELQIQHHRQRQRTTTHNRPLNPILEFADPTTQSVTPIAHQVARNGYIYAIDTILMPPSILRTLSDVMDAPTTLFAKQEPETSTSFFYHLLEMADLISLLQIDESDDDDDDNYNDNDSDDIYYTIFAPTNAAFAKVNDEILAYLQSPDGADKLHELLLYHIVPHHVYPSVHLAAQSQSSSQSQDSDASSTMRPTPMKLQTMLKGRDITAVVVGVNEEIEGSMRSSTTSTIHLHGDNTAKVVVADQLARNGILHMISKVLLPPHRPDASTKTTDMKDVAAFVDGSAVSGSNETSTGSSRSTVVRLGTREVVPIEEKGPTTTTRAAPSPPPPLSPEATVSSRAPPQPPVPLSVPAVMTATPPAPSREWSLPSPTMNDMVNVPIVRYPREGGGVKLKVVLP